MVTKVMQHFEHQVLAIMLLCYAYVPLNKQEKLATLHRKREEQIQWVKKNVEDQ